MIALEIWLIAAATWSGASYAVICRSNALKVAARQDASTGSRAAGLAMIAFILAVGFLGLLLK